MSSAEMALEVQRIREFGAFPTEISEQRSYYESLFAQAVPDEGTLWAPEELGGIGLGDSEWQWHRSASSERVFLFFHGGGFVRGIPRAWRQFGGRVSRASGMRGLSVDYRLAPENPFPAAVEDAFAAYRWVLDQGVAPADMSLIGASAGGALVLTTCLLARERSAPFPGSVIAISPWTDHAFTSPTFAPETGDPMTSRASAGRMSADYRAGADARDPLVSPLYADLTALPPIHVESGTRDVLHGDSELLLAALRSAGNDVSHNFTEGAVHTYPILTPETPEADASLERIGARMRAGGRG